jgi:flagellar protein FliO/FliZ
MSQLGPVGIALIALGAVLVLGLAALVLRWTVFSRRKGRKHEHETAGFHGDGRIAVLETTVIDERRKLVLVRCDDVEHLIVVGGPADLLVESDVKKVRPQAPAARTPPAHPLQALPAAQPAASPPRVPPAMGASLDAAIAAAIPKGSPDTRSSRSPAEPRAPLPPREGLATVNPRPAGRNGESLSPPAPPRIEETPRPAVSRAPARDTARREAAQPRRAAPQPAARQIEPPRPQTGGERSARTGRANGEPGGLPVAQVPWVEPASIEDEIGQALRFETPRSAAAPAARREPAPAKSAVDSTTTLGDLADRLEEALAREIQTVASPTARRAEPEPPEPRAERGTSGSMDNTERTKRPAGRDRQEKRERPESTRQSAPPEPAREPPQPERREEAPVISLNARRREASDPLEDEMARLLGELTGDTKGR